MEKQRIKDRDINYVHVVLAVYGDCNPEEGEYDLIITGFIGHLDIYQEGGVDDISLIKECVINDIENYPQNGELHIVLRESGEWEDVFWHKYYEIERITQIDY